MLAKAYGVAVVHLRWLVLAFWLLATAGALLYLPGADQGGGDLSNLVSQDNPAVRSETQAASKFGFPLLSRVAIVQRKADGLPLDVQANAVKRAQAVSEGEYTDVKPIVAAVPVGNTLKMFPGSKENGTTIITWLFTDPEANFAEQADAAKQFQDKHFDPRDGVIGTTGSVPARVEQGRILLSYRPWLELATVAAVFIIVAIAFRSITASLLALSVAGIAILLTLRIGGALAMRLGVPIPQETQPLLVALLLGVVTDYVVFYLSAMRGFLAEGESRIRAAELATARYTPIIVIAGLTAAAGTGALSIAGSPAFQAFGPGMAMSVLMGMFVAVTLVPALLAIFGRMAVWSLNRTAKQAEIETEASQGRWARLLTRPWFAMPVLVLAAAGLIFAAMPVRHMSLGLSFVEALPRDNPSRVAQTEAAKGFAPGILSPTELLIEGSGADSHQQELAKLQQSLHGIEGVAGVAGPGDQEAPKKLFTAPDGTAARYLIILNDEPLGARAAKTVARIQQQLPQLLKDAGLTGFRASLGGDTAVAKAIVDQTTHDLGQIAIAALAANLMFLMLFLRAVRATLALLLCSVLAIAATLGITTWVFEDVLGDDGITFYVPLAAAVLLVALGSDYNIFGIGPAWKVARRKPLREALAVTLPQSARAIRTAAITLAVSFGLLALVPLRPFRELAFALSIGILIDAFVVRSLLAPALLAVWNPRAETEQSRLRQPLTNVDVRP